MVLHSDGATCQLDTSDGRTPELHGSCPIAPQWSQRGSKEYLETPYGAGMTCQPCEQVTFACATNGAQFKAPVKVNNKIEHEDDVNRQSSWQKSKPTSIKREASLKHAR